MPLNKKSTILFDARPMASPKTGVGYYMENIMRSFTQAYPEIQLTGYYFDFLGLEKKQLPTIPGVRYKKIRWFPYKGISLLRRLGLQAPLPFLMPSAYFYDIIFFPDFVSLPIFGKAKSCAVVHDVGFEDVPEYVSTINGSFLRRFVPKTISAVDHIICDSEFTKDRIVKNYGTSRKKISVVYPGVESIYTAKPKSHGPVVFVGTIEPRKNIDSLIRAYAQLPTLLQQRHPLVLAGGKGWKDDKINQTTAEYIAKGLPIINRGYITDKEKVNLYKSASAVVLIPHYEGFGMQILEAMQFNTPLLLGDIPVFREVAGLEVTYCNKDSINNIAHKLTFLLQSTPKHDYRKTIAKFSNAKSAYSLYTVFNIMLGGE